MSKLAKQTGNTSLLASAYNQLSDNYIKLGKFDDAKIASEQSLKLSYENGVINNIRESAHLLSIIYREQGNYKSALEMSNLFIKMKDSVNNEENVKKIAAIEYAAKEGFKAEQKAKEVTFKAEQEKKEVELNRRRNHTLCIYNWFCIGSIISSCCIQEFTTKQKEKHHHYRTEKRSRTPERIGGC